MGTVSALILQGDCRKCMPPLAPFDMVVADPPYGDTSLKWDKRVQGWHQIARDCLKLTGSMWVFGSLRYFMLEAGQFEAAGLRYAQEIVWEKHNGSGFRADRFKRVHELAVQFYRDDAPWDQVFNQVQYTPDATARTVRRKKRPPHMGQISESHFVSQDGGPRLMRSVIFAPSPRKGRHPTEKPVQIMEALIRTSCPPGGLVGDFFAGAGTAGEAASLCGREYVGAELDEGYAAIASDRLAGILPGLCAA